MNVKCEDPNLSCPDIVAIRCFLLIPYYSFVIWLTSIALGHFGHLTESLGI
jgi:hypothetical protein